MATRHSKPTKDRLAVFRVDHTKPMIKKELQQGRLRQGWGGKHMSLLDKKGDPIDRWSWGKNYEKQGWGPPSQRRHGALAKMLELEEGDLVVIPKVPEDDQFSLARVTGKYVFDFETDPKGGDGDDFRHMIPIDPDSLRRFHYRAAPQTFVISNLFVKANHRYPVTFSHEAHVIKSAIELLDDGQDLLDGKDSKTLVEAALDDALKQAAVAMKEAVAQWNGRQFEAAVKQVFESQGYRQQPYRQWNKQGGDADMVFAPPETIYSLFMPGEVIVQVKWKQGKDRDDLDGVEQLEKWNESENLSARKFLISSGDDFTDECKKKAEEKDITLIGGRNTMYFLMGLPPKED